MSRWLLFLMPLVAGCWHTAPGHPPVSAPAAAPRPVAPSDVPRIELVDDAAWDACTAVGGELEGGLSCDTQSLENGVPLRYLQFPAIARDGSVLAVVEERDGGGHIRPGVRLIDRDGRTVQWLALDVTGDAARSVTAANAALATRNWVALSVPAKHEQQLADDLVETRLGVGGFTAVYQQRNAGDGWLPPSDIHVEDARGRVVAHRTDTEQAWTAPPACNLPSFELVGASATPGVLLFMTGPGTGSHACDGVAQPPTWHVLTFAP